MDTMGLEKLKQYMNEDIGFNRHNGIRFTVVEEGYCEVQVDLTENSLNPQRVTHGSLLFGLCDCCTGVASASIGREMLTQSANIHFLRPGTGKTLTAKSRLIKMGRTTAVFGAEVYDDKGKLVCSGTFDIFYTSDTMTWTERLK